MRLAVDFGAVNAILKRDRVNDGAIDELGMRTLFALLLSATEFARAYDAT